MKCLNNMRSLLPLSWLIVAFLVVACSPESQTSEVPKPIAMTEEAVGHYCSMNILEHAGPKVQIHLDGIEHPIWFSQVRDGVAYMRSPEKTYRTTAVFVHDMAKATSWNQPGDHAWIDATEAFFVLGSKMAGGMGAPETIPFGTKAAAEDFVAKHGGNVMLLSAIPDSYVLSPVEIKFKDPNSVSVTK
jgi:copper chaperone NosL